MTRIGPRRGRSLFRRASLCVIVVASAVMAAGCFGGGDGGAADGIHIAMEDSVFKPDRLTVGLGTHTISYENDGNAIHNIVIHSSAVEGTDFSSPTIVQPGENGSFEVTLTKPGELTFVCVYHQPGMSGTLVVQ